MEQANSDERDELLATLQEGMAVRVWLKTLPITAPSLTWAA